MNNETIIHHSVYIQNVTDVNETTVYYNITGLHPFLNYSFIAYIMDIFNNIKNQNYATLCKLIICWFALVLSNLLLCFHSNLPCPRTHSTVLL